MASSMTLSLDEEETQEETEVKWINIIFAPFHYCLKFIVLIVVIIKCAMGPLSAVYSFVKCSDRFDFHPVLKYTKYFYIYLCDPIYITDTFLYIVHRQVKDEAVRREYLPKSAFLILLDIISVIPIMSFIADKSVCLPPQFWPNILAFNEYLIIYRIVDYFDLVYTHSIVNLIVGHLLLYLLTVNALTCGFLLLTYSKGGLCPRCNIGPGVYDWRAFIFRRFNESSEAHTYVYSATFMISLLLSKLVDQIRPRTIIEFQIATAALIAGYLTSSSVITPKFFAEGLLRTRRITSFNYRVKRIIEDIERRNPNKRAHKAVEEFYSLMWEKRKGITSIPEVVNEFPVYLKVDIKIDLVWPVFHHSPTFRKTSSSYKRWLCEFIHLEYKLPGEKFFTGFHCYTNLYYIKTGIVQIFSTDDSTSALLSVTSGTLFGDTSFVIPPLNRKLIVRCLTYCEIFVITRAAILNSLHLFPGDRRNIMTLVSERIKHARTLYACKQQIRGFDRTEDEGTAWIKKRWWEIYNTISRSTKIKDKKLQIPPEESYYHCAKYIGQLVLCSESQLQEKTMFLKKTFPWILIPHTSFGYVWEQIVYITVWAVLILYPPNLLKLTLNNGTSWFLYVQYTVNLIFFIDILITLVTSQKSKSYLSRARSEVFFSRFKDLYFTLDLLATCWTEYFAVAMGKPQYFYAAQFNRLLKVYVLFCNRYKESWTRRNNPIRRILYVIALTHFIYYYISGYFLYIWATLTPELSIKYFFGETCLIVEEIIRYCKPRTLGILNVVMDYIFEAMFPSTYGVTTYDTSLRMTLMFITFLVNVFTKTILLPILYLKYRDIINYQYFVHNLKKYYAHHNIHPVLMKRLDRYLICQWKNYKGMDIIHPTSLKDEPYDIYWKLQGEIAEKIISESGLFKHADPHFIRELANKAKFMILPKDAALLLFGAEHTIIAWLVKGMIKSEYENDNGEVINTYINPGALISITSVFIGKVPLRSYIAATACELLYIRKQDYRITRKRFPIENSYIEVCEKELLPQFNELHLNYQQRHSVFYKNQRRCIFLGKHVSISTALVNFEKNFRPKSIFLDYTMNPESTFIRWWMRFRVCIIFLSIICASVQGGSGSYYKKQLSLVTLFCDIIGIIDICIKLFLPYYNKQGLIISARRKCILHYMSRGFIFDFIGSFPVHSLLANLILYDHSDNLVFLCQTLCKFAHIYLVIGLFEYEADQPMVNAAYLMILKWQLCIILVMFGASHYFMTKCVNFSFDANNNLNATKIITCWLPNFLPLDDKPTIEQLHMLYAKSISLSQCSFMRNQNGKWHLIADNFTLVICFFTLGVIFWYFMCYSQTLLVLNYRGNTIFQHGVKQLQDFLTSERVNQELTKRVVAHFRYWWIRTKGINVQNLMSERIGLIFRQDLSFYFYKSTILAANTVLQGDVNFRRHLACYMSLIYFLPGGDIMREMDLTSTIYFVHRGKVQLYKNGQKVALLSKGSIFGQLRDSVLRPIRVTATAAVHSDILCMSLKQFHDSINDEIRNNININPQSEDDYVEILQQIPEKAADNIQYILRGRKMIKLPKMRSPVTVEQSKLYAGWLYCALLIGPFCTFVMILMLGVVDRETRDALLHILILFDVIHMANVVMEFFTMELKIVNDECVYQYIRLRKLLNVTFFFDVVSFFFAIVGYITYVWEFHFGRLGRIYCILVFYKRFCKHFESRLTSIVIKISLVLLLLHALSCGWIYVACKDDFPIQNPEIPEVFARDIDFSVWTDPNKRHGCRTTTSSFTVNGTEKVAFFVPSKWTEDYTIAFLYIIVILTAANMDHVIALTVKEVYYRIFITIVLYLLDLWICSVTISTVYTKFHEIYVFDFQVSNLLNYLKLNGLCEALMEAVTKYTKQLWKRQKGCWLPEITHQAPPCLREDIMEALYIHHLEIAPIFQDLPHYFLRQLSTRLTRVVIYPGKHIVREGDVMPTIHFIHEGEVEKWHIDSRGDSKLSSVLLINGYFGIIPGLFPNLPYKCTYYTRTVVDLVTLKFNNWQDLLAGYPDIKTLLYSKASLYRKELASYH